MPKCVKCLMCYGADAETQERLKDRKPEENCPLCRGTGGLEVQFNKDTPEGAVTTLGRLGRSGFPMVEVASEG